MIVFFDPMDCSPWFEREIWPKLKVTIIIFETGVATPTKIGVHVCYINLYLDGIFELILINKFLPTMESMV